MEHLVFVFESSTAKCQKPHKVPIHPEKYGAIKSEARNYQSPLWNGFETPRGLQP